MTVLIIDDEPMITEITTKILSRVGCTVLTATSGAAGVAVFCTNRDTIDLVILDLTLEDMPGTEVLRQIRQERADCPCIISSGQVSSLKDIPEDLQKRVSFLQKPFRAEQLVTLAKEITSALASR